MLLCQERNTLGQYFLAFWMSLTKQLKFNPVSNYVIIFTRHVIEVSNCSLLFGLVPMACGLKFILRNTRNSVLQKYGSTKQCASYQVGCKHFCTVCVMYRRSVVITCLHNGNSHIWRQKVSHKTCLEAMSTYRFNQVLKPAEIRSFIT